MIKRFCELTENGIFYYSTDISHCVESMFGKIIAQIGALENNTEYVYDYSCLMGKNPDVMLYTKDCYEPIGLYKIDDD